MDYFKAVYFAAVHTPGIWRDLLLYCFLYGTISLGYRLGLSRYFTACYRNCSCTLMYYSIFGPPASLIYCTILVFSRYCVLLYIFFQG